MEHVRTQTMRQTDRQTDRPHIFYLSTQVNIPMTPPPAHPQAPGEAGTCANSHREIALYHWVTGANPSPTNPPFRRLPIQLHYIQVRYAVPPVCENSLISFGINEVQCLYSTLLYSSTTLGIGALRDHLCMDHWLSLYLFLVPHIQNATLNISIQHMN